MASRSTAEATFWDLSELVGNMIIQLPLKDILLVQRVSKYWKAIITQSPSIQKALFFRPTEKIQLRLIEDRDVIPASCASQLDCYTPRQGEYWSVPTAGGITRWGVTVSDEREYRIIVNPILGLEKPWSEAYFYENLFRGVQDRFLRDRAYGRPEASWRKMLFSQPPLKEAIVDHCAYHWHLVEAGQESHGLTLHKVHRSTMAFGGELRSIWGEDGFGLGVAPGSTGAVVLAALGEKPGKIQLNLAGEGKGTAAGEQAQTGHGVVGHSRPRGIDILGAVDWVEDSEDEESEDEESEDEEIGNEESELEEVETHAETGVKMEESERLTARQK